MKISFEGIDEKIVTFIGKDVKAGEPVRVSDAGTVTACSNGQDFDGFVAGVTGEYAGVIIGGAVSASYSGSAPGFGSVALCADGSGGVKCGGSVKHLVVDVDETANIVTFIM